MKNLNKHRAWILNNIYDFLLYWKYEKELKPVSKYQLDRMIRWYTEFCDEGKRTYNSVTRLKKYHKWTSAAIELIENDTNAKKNFGKLFTHEHIVPVKIIIEKLRNLPDVFTKKDVYNILEETEVIVVTRTEDKVLSESGYQSSGTRKERLSVLTPLHPLYKKNQLF